MKLLDVDFLPKRGVHNVALWRVAHEVERIAGRERDRRQPSGQQHANIVGVNDFNLVNGVGGLRSGRR